MASNTVMAALNKCLSLISGLQTKVDAMELKVAHGGITPQSNVAYVSAPTFDLHVKRVDTIETQNREMTRTLADLRNALANVREELVKERSVIETSVMFKTEQFCNRSIKERIDNTMFDIKTMNENRAVDLENNLNSHVQQMLFEQETNIKTYIDKQLASLRSTIASNPSQAQDVLPVATKSVASSTPVPIEPPVPSTTTALDLESPCPSPPPTLQSQDADEDNATIARPSPLQAPSLVVTKPTFAAATAKGTTANVTHTLNGPITTDETHASHIPNDFSAGRRKIIRGPRKA